MTKEEDLKAIPILDAPEEMLIVCDCPIAEQPVFPYVWPLVVAAIIMIATNWLPPPYVRTVDPLRIGSGGCKFNKSIQDISRSLGTLRIGFNYYANASGLLSGNISMTLGSLRLEPIIFDREIQSGAGSLVLLAEEALSYNSASLVGKLAGPLTQADFVLTWSTVTRTFVLTFVRLMMGLALVPALFNALGNTFRFPSLDSVAALLTVAGGFLYAHPFYGLVFVWPTAWDEGILTILKVTGLALQAAGISIALLHLGSTPWFVSGICGFLVSGLSACGLGWGVTRGLQVFFPESWRPLSMRIQEDWFWFAGLVVVIILVIVAVFRANDAERQRLRFLTATVLCYVTAQAVITALVMFVHVRCGFRSMFRLVGPTAFALIFAAGYERAETLDEDAYQLQGT